MSYGTLYSRQKTGRSKSILSLFLVKGSSGLLSQALYGSIGTAKPQMRQLCQCQKCQSQIWVSPGGAGAGIGFAGARAEPNCASVTADGTSGRYELESDTIQSPLELLHPFRASSPLSSDCGIVRGNRASLRLVRTPTQLHVAPSQSQYQGLTYRIRMRYPHGTHTVQRTHVFCDYQSWGVSVLSCCVHERAVKSPFLPGETLVAQPLQSGLGYFSKWGSWNYCFCQYILASVHNMAKHCIGSPYNLTKLKIKMPPKMEVALLYKLLILLTLHFLHFLHYLHCFHQCAWSISEPSSPINCLHCLHC